MGTGMSATRSLICSQRNAGVGGKVVIWSRARASCSAASTCAERSSDRSPALPHRSAAFSINRPRISDVPAVRLIFSDVREAPFEGFGDASVQCASRLAQKAAVSRILDQRVLKEITRMGRYTLAEQQPDQNDPIQSWPQLLLARACVMTEPAERE